MLYLLSVLAEGANVGSCDLVSDSCFVHVANGELRTLDARRVNKGKVFERNL